MLVCNPPGTPYTDLLINRVTVTGAQVEPVQAAVTGGGEPLALVEARAVALTPTGWPAGEDAVAVELSERVDLPLVALWLAGGPSSAVRRLRSAMGEAS